MHSDARTVECIGISAGAEATSTETCGTETTGAQADSGKELGFGNDPRASVRRNSTTP